MSGYQHNLPQNIDLTPRKHHGYAVLLFIFGTLFPPIAVAARFGIGGDFWLNLLLTVCGYIPGHGHNFYIQNIRNNKNHRRTPKWVQRYGLVDLSEIKRKERKSQWSHRYNDRLPESTLEGQPYEEGQAGSSLDLRDNRVQPQRTGGGELWRPEDESYYGEANNSSSSSGRWHYPANFEDSGMYDSGSKKSKKKKDKKDRWARTEDAYTMSEEQRKKKKKKSKKNKQSSDTFSIPSSRDSGTDFPEDPEGGLYSERNRRRSLENGNGQAAAKTGDDVFNHQF